MFSFAQHLLFAPAVMHVEMTKSLPKTITARKMSCSVSCKMFCRKCSGLSVVFCSIYRDYRLCVGMLLFMR